MSRAYLMKTSLHLKWTDARTNIPFGCSLSYLNLFCLHLTSFIPKAHLNPSSCFYHFIMKLHKQLSNAYNPHACTGHSLSTQHIFIWPPTCETDLHRINAAIHIFINPCKDLFLLLFARVLATIYNISVWMDGRHDLPVVQSIPVFFWVMWRMQGRDHSVAEWNLDTVGS